MAFATTAFPMRPSGFPDTLTLLHRCSLSWDTVATTSHAQASKLSRKPALEQSLPAEQLASRVESQSELPPIRGMYPKAMPCHAFFAR